MFGIAFMASLLASCGGDIPTPAATSTTTAVTLQGQLTDSITGQAIAGARIAIGSRSATTDSNGYYQIGNYPANSSGGVARDYLATITLTDVSSPVYMLNTATTPRYPDLVFRMPASPGANDATTTHNFKVGKMSASIQGVTGDANFKTIGGVIVELQDNSTGTAGNIIRATTSDAATGGFTFANVEAGVDYKLVGQTSDGIMQGNVTTGKLVDNQTLSLPLGGMSSLVLSSTDTYSPRIIKVSPENNADVDRKTTVHISTIKEMKFI